MYLTRYHVLQHTLGVIKYNALYPLMPIRNALYIKGLNKVLHYMHTLYLKLYLLKPITYLIRLNA